MYTTEKLRKRLGRTPTPMEVQADRRGYCCVFGMISLMEGSLRSAEKEFSIPRGTLSVYRRRLKGGELKCGNGPKCMKETL